MTVCGKEETIVQMGRIREGDTHTLASSSRHNGQERRRNRTARLQDSFPDDDETPRMSNDSLLS